MALNFSGRQVPTLSGTNLQATDSANGAQVLVKVSSEAWEDHGQSACEAAADRKHSNGQVDEEGNVSVRTTDF